MHAETDAQSLKKRERGNGSAGVATFVSETAAADVPARGSRSCLRVKERRNVGRSNPEERSGVERSWNSMTRVPQHYGSLGDLRRTFSMHGK